MFIPFRQEEKRMSKEEKRTLILKAAGRVFYLKGFEGTKIEDVAKEAGIGKGTVYEYFASKQQLFEEMVAYNRELHINSIQTALQAAGTFRGKFLALAKYQTEAVSKHIHIFETIVCSRIMAREVGALLLEQDNRVGEVLKTVVSEAINDGQLRADLDPEMVAAVMMGTINQYCSKKVVFYQVEPEEIDFEKLVDVVMLGIAG
jgi:AcrR family transcriptional regulator